MNRPDTITDEQWQWWLNLPFSWKKIFTAHIYYYDEVYFSMLHPNNEFTIFEKGVTALFEKNDLLHIFNLKTLHFGFLYSKKDVISYVNELYEKGETKTNSFYEAEDVLSEYQQYWGIDVDSFPDFKYFSNIENIFIANTSLRDLSSLSQLKNLECLTILGNDVSDFSVLKELKGLKILRLYERISEEELNALKLDLDSCVVQYGISAMELERFKFF